VAFWDPPSQSQNAPNDKRSPMNSKKTERMNKEVKWAVELPCVATLLIGSRSSLAMKPMMANVTKPPNTLVSMSPVATTIVSL